MKITSVEQVDKNMKIETDIQREDIVWLDAKDAPFAISGVQYDAEQGCYVRMPQSVANAVSDGVAWLNRNTAGGRVRFRTNSGFIGIRMVSKNTKLMNHMPATGQSGFDLYRKLDDGRGDLYYHTFRPPTFVTDGYSSPVDTDGQEAEYTINFPLYDGVQELYIALQKDAFLAEPEPYAVQKPVVYYGSSITQGGCASRPGNSYQAMITRRLNAEHINLGFSGSCKAEEAMIDYLCGLDMSVFVYDYDHNAPDADFLWKTHAPLYRKLRKAKPDLPIIIVSAPCVLLRGGQFIQRREAVRATYEEAKAAGDENVYFIDGGTLFEGEGWDSCTVDGGHPNDLGFYRMSVKIGAVVEEALKKRK